MRTLLAFVLPLALPVLASCGGDGTSASGRTENLADFVSMEVQSGPPTARGMSQSVGPRQPPAALPSSSVALPRDAAEPTSMIIRSGDAAVQVDSLEPGIARLHALARGLGGYVANTSIQAGDRAPRSASLELKIPAERFDEAISGLRPLGTLESVTISAQDVGEEFVDISARVANAERLEQRLVALLATRTGSLQDVLAVERELARIREEIERYQGRLRYLRTRSAISTLRVTLREPLPIVGPYPGANPIAGAFRDAWRNFVGFLAGAITALGWLVPLAGLAALAWVAIRRLLRRYDGDARPRIGRRPDPPTGSEP